MNRDYDIMAMIDYEDAMEMALECCAKAIVFFTTDTPDLWDGEFVGWFDGYYLRNPNEYEDFYA